MISPRRSSGSFSVVCSASDRLSAGLQADPVRYLQIDLQYRETFTAVPGAEHWHDFLAQLHGWF